MSGHLDRIDNALGRLVFRAFGFLCAIVAFGCAYAAWWHYDNRASVGSVVPAIMFAVVALAAGSCVPYCLSRKRTFTEALDAMEGGVGDLPPRPKR